ncbi:O-antigen ligase family protein [Halobacteriovorax sp. GB3]|uniref:O-antigen ligase family protein n=1 Tax=Halobacteriovorax sp. GB3 TaxID=2719615 RepID=UPI00235FB1D6|nr:O-antigen ligase family protein [Halobacteriovorax sp. GB3]MDD0852502.1 O-antigen ligase family protein [Halobacteriovorax sp. GB3]
MTQFEKWNYRLTYASLFVLAAGIFTSVSFSALSHIFIIIPGFYFAIKFYKEKPFKLPRSFWFLGAMCIAIVASVLMNTDSIERPFKNISKIKYFLLPMLGVFAYFYTFKNWMTAKREKVLFNTFLLATTVATISGIIGLYSGFNPIKMKDACHATRACGLYGMYMTYGYGISLFMVLMTGIVLYKDRFTKYINVNLIYLVWAINFIGLILSYARGAWIGFLVALPFFFFKKNRKIFISVIAGVVLVSGLSFLSPKVREMFFKREGSNTQRIAFYKAAVAAFSEKPVFGFGYRNFEPNVIEIKKRHNIEWPNVDGHAHNNYLEHLASTGSVGVVVMLLFLSFWLFEAYLTSVLIFPFVISFLTSGMVQYTFGDGENLFLIMGLWALGVVGVKLRES